MPLTAWPHYRIAVAGLAILCAVTLAAQAPPVLKPHASLPTPKPVTVEAHRAHLTALRQVVAECEHAAAACDAARVGDDDRVQPQTGASYVERYDWLRDLLSDESDPGHKNRPKLLAHAGQRLEAQEAAIGSATPAPQLTGAQRAARMGVLNRNEFRTVEDFSLSERIGNWISELLGKLFSGASSLGRRAPWLGATLEWGALLLAAALLLLWVYRAIDRQRIALGRLHGEGARSVQERESRAWAERARAHAEQGEWRDAVHCLYWASIIALEDRRTLRPSSTRTPREALRLIDPESRLRQPLQAQTGEFERIWYGLQPAVAADYQGALAQYEVLLEGARRTASRGART